MDVGTLYRRTLEMWADRVADAADCDWTAPTPCREWTVRDLVNHVTGEDLWTAPLLRGETIERVGDRFDGDLLGSEPVSRALYAAGQASALVAEEISEPVVIDHTPPVLKSARPDGKGARIAVYDAGSPPREAKLSIDGGEWSPLGSADGLVDGRTEELIVAEIPERAGLVLVRLSDAAFNERTFDLSEELARGSGR